MEDKILIGTLLKTQREHLSYSIRDIASKTKINLNILKSLEDNDLNALPNKTYVKGFVKSYAKTVGIHQDDAMDSLELTYQEVLGIVPEKEDQPTQLGSLQSTNTEETENEEMKETFVSIAQGFFNKKYYTLSLSYLYLQELLRV
jgi:cytoskeleton protein RodZ